MPLLIQTDHNCQTWTFRTPDNQRVILQLNATGVRCGARLISWHDLMIGNDQLTDGSYWHHSGLFSLWGGGEYIFVRCDLPDETLLSLAAYLVQLQDQYLEDDEVLEGVAYAVAK